MKFVSLQLLLISTCLLLPISNDCLSQSTVIVANEDVLIDYQRFIGQRQPEKIQSYTGPHARRDVIELLLLVQILHLGGFNRDIRLKAEVSYKRILHMVSQGTVSAYGTPVWHRDIAAQADRFWVSDAMVRNGEFVVGIYTSPDNKIAMAANANTLSQLTAVSNPQWSVDWQTLNQLKLKWLYSTNSWDHMVKMVNAKRADFTLSPFYPTEDMSLTAADITLTPIPNIRVALDGSRHWAISQKHPDGAAMRRAIKVGMDTLRQRGTIVRAYTESGFFDRRVELWPIINADTAKRSRP